jgi:glycosyltransferase involved in cell wall biosynthesis
MKVCFLGIDLIYRGGVQNYSSNLIANMSKESSIDEILVVCDEIDEAVFKSIEQSKLRIYCTGRPKSGDFPRVVFRNSKSPFFFKEIEKYDVVHVLDDKALPVIAPFSRKMVITVHAIMMQELLVLLKNIGPIGLRKLPRMFDHYGPQVILEFFSIGKSEKVVISSPIVAKGLKRLYGNWITDKLRVIPPGFDPKVFNPNFMSQIQARQRLGLDGSAKILMVIGGEKTSSTRKGLPYVLRALDELHKTGDLGKLNILLLIVGDFPENLKQEFAHLQKHIFQQSYVSEDLLPVFYKAADLFIMASMNDGWGMVLIEALACGTPVISSNNVVAAFATEGTGAVRIEPNTNNPTLFARSIREELLDEKAQDWGKIFDFLVETCSWKSVCDSFLKVYAEIINASEQSK